MSKILFEKRNWQIASDGRRLEQKKLGLVLLPQHASLLVHEWPTWQRWYCPVSIRGKDVLDVGAGCGETAYFYFKRGARKVICVEPNRSAVECLVENVARHCWNVEIVPEAFRADMFRENRFDFMKMDGEGCEEQLLHISDFPTEAIVESHSPELTEALTKRFHARAVVKVSQRVTLLQIAADEPKPSGKNQG
jgi:precorrin-6B methylase 2